MSRKVRHLLNSQITYITSIFMDMTNKIFHSRSKVYDVASSILSVNCGAGGPLIIGQLSISQRKRGSAKIVPFRTSQ
jgi:hypothetical protein